MIGIRDRQPYREVSARAQDALDANFKQALDNQNCMLELAPADYQAQD
jgi:hypothetical protein